MLWIVLKIVLFLGVVAGLTLGLETLMQQDAGLRMAFGDIEFTLGPVQMALGALALLGALWLLMKLMGLLVATIRFINGDDTAISRYFERSRKRRGLEALTDGFLALATGEGDKALTKARKAEKLLENRTLTNLLIAQSAQSKGNAAMAEEYYKRLLDDDRSRFVGVQGLLRGRIAAGDTAKARALAETALTLQPNHAGTQDTLLDLQAKAGDWQGARKTLLEVSRAGRMPRPLYQRRDAVLALQQAASLQADGDDARAQGLAIEANGLSPELVPAAVRAAMALNAQGKGKQAAKLLKRAWKSQPHPELAQAFAALEPAEAPAARVKRFEALLSQAEGPEAAMTRAELLIAAEDFPAARRAIGDLHETAPTQRVLTIMAAIERGEGSADHVVRGWLARALTAPKGAQWVCDKCQHEHAAWQALCGHCGAFDTLSWTSPPDSSGPSATGTEMLPLIVGALPPTPVEDPAETVDEEPVIEARAEPVAEDQPETAAQPAGVDVDQARRSGL